MAIYDSIDIDFSWDGDFSISDEGDLKVNDDDFIRATENAVQSIAKNSFGDWQFDQQVASDLSDFIGRPNTRENGRLIEQRVKSRLVANRVAEPQDITVRVTPITIHEIAILVRINAASTNGNRLQSGEPVVVGLLFDTNEGNVFVNERKQSQR